MIIVKCIRNVEKELEVINLELERTGNNDLELIDKKEELIRYLNKYQEALKGMNDLESRLYCKIVVDGLNPMKAIEKVAEENYLMDIRPCSPDHIRKYIYKKIKKYIECP